MYGHYICKKTHGNFIKDKIYEIDSYIDFEVYYFFKDDNGKEVPGEYQMKNFKELNKKELKRILTINSIIQS